MNKKNTFITISAFVVIVILYVLSHALSSNTLDIKPTQSISIVPKVKEERSLSINTNASDTHQREYEEILSSSPLSKQQALLKQLLSNLDENGVFQAASFFASLDLDNETHQILNLLILKHWASISVPNTLTFIQDQFTKPFKQVAIQSIIKSQCSNLESRPACIRALPNNASIDKALLSIASHAKQSNQFSNALLWANSVFDEEKRNNAIMQISDDWLDHAPEEAFQWTANNPDFISIARQAINIIVKTDPWQAYNLVSSINEDHGDNRKSMYKSIISSLIEEGDFLTVMSVLESTSQHQSITDVAREWIEIDPKSALEWALNYEEFSVLSLRAMDELTKKDHWGAYELIFQIPSSQQELRQNMLISIISNRADNDDFSSIMSMMEKLPNGENIETYYESFISKWAWQDPASAMAAVTQLPESPEKIKFFTDTITLWGEKEPLAALKAAQAETSKDLQSAALGGVIEGWAVKDIDELIDWVKNQPTSSSLDQTLVTASTNLFNKVIDIDIEIERESIAKLVNTISDEAMRLEIQQKIQPLEKSDAELEFSN